MPLSDELLDRRLHRGALAGVSSEAVTGLTFPNNTAISTSIKVAFKFTGANLPNITPLTIIWRAMFTGAQTGAGYWTTFFHSRGDGSFSATPDYVGCHPYNNNHFEISAEGGDDTTDENGFDTTIEYGRWYHQAMVNRPGSGSRTITDFYWDLAAGTNRIISRETSDPGGLVNSANSPHLMFGENLWSTERMNGTLRGLQIDTASLSSTHINLLRQYENTSDVVAYRLVNGLSAAWYANLNPTPDDISDKSGAGHHPTWQDSGNKPTLWTP